MNVEKDAAALSAEILELKKKKGAVIMAHYYQKGEIQDVADYIGDSLALAQLARKVEEPVIVLCGVHFMGETAKILCPDKTVLIPDADAGCSLADSCPGDDFEKFINEHPGHTVVSYVNTTARVKALTDVVVTSGNAREIVEALPADEKIIFGPDRNLGSYINALTGREMLLWDGACHVHEKFSLEAILRLKEEHPGAQVLVHPECRPQLRMIADKIGSTAVLLKYAMESPAQTFIVATESDATTCGCNDCSYMKLNTLRKLRDCLLTGQPEIKVDPELAERARRPIERMLEMSKNLKK